MNSTLYRVFGLRLESFIELPGIDEGHRPPDLRVVSGLPSALRGERAERYLAHPADVDDPWIELLRNEDSLGVRFPDYVTFGFSGSDDTLYADVEPGCPPNTLMHFLLDQALPLFLASRGRLVVHGSAVARENQAIAFIGPTGVGKSTLTAASTQHGFDLLADDAVLLDMAPQPSVVGSYRGLRLWPETARQLGIPIRDAETVASYTDKRRVPITSYRWLAGPTPLRAIYFLGAPSERVLLERISPKRAMLRLSEQLFRVRRDDKDLLTSEFRQLCELVETTPAFELLFPRDFAILADVVAAL